MQDMLGDAAWIFLKHAASIFSEYETPATAEHNSEWNSDPYSNLEDVPFLEMLLFVPNVL